MEALVAIAIMAVIYIFSMMRKLSSTDVEAVEDIPQSSLGDAFPRVEPLVLPEAKRTPSKQRHKAKNSAPKRTTQHVPVVVKAEEKEPSAPCEQQKTDYSIKDKQDAKKAVIYAEIFNRKYF